MESQPRDEVDQDAAAIWIEKVEIDNFMGCVNLRSIWKIVYGRILIDWLCFGCPV